MAGILLYFAGGAKTATEFFVVACSISSSLKWVSVAIRIYTPRFIRFTFACWGPPPPWGWGALVARSADTPSAFMGAGTSQLQMWIFLGTGCFIAGLITIWLGIEPKGQNLEQLIERAQKAQRSAGKKKSLWLADNQTRV